MASGIHRLEYPDGVLEITTSSAVTGPDQVDGQHFGTSYVYARLDDGAWWRVVGVRSRHMTLKIAKQYASAREAIGALCEPDA